MWTIFYFSKVFFFHLPVLRKIFKSQGNNIRLNLKEFKSTEIFVSNFYKSKLIEEMRDVIFYTTHRNLGWDYSYYSKWYKLNL